MQRAMWESSCITLLSLTVQSVEALRMAVITFLLPNQPYLLSMNLPLMFPPLLATTTSVLLRK